MLLARTRGGQPVDASASPFPDLRRALHGRTSTFADLLEHQDLVLETSRLVYLARWITPELEPRRFDARFFLAAAPCDVVSSHDDRESVETRWLRPAVAVEQGRAGSIVLPPPTTKTLELLAGLASVAAMLDWARQREPVTVCPEARLQGDTIWILLPGAPGSVQPRSVYPGPTRYALSDGHWVPGD